MVALVQRKNTLFLVVAASCQSQVTAFTLRERPVTLRRTPHGGVRSVSKVYRSTIEAKSTNLLTSTLLLAQLDENANSPETASTDPESWTWLGRLVLPLWLVYVSNQWSRSSLYYLVNFDTASDDSTAAFTAMNVALSFDQAQYGILASLAFTTLFALASLGAGYAADRFSRRTLTLVSVVGWTLATYGTSQADSYETVLACRIAMGLACAVSTPTAYTWIRDLVPATRQATASSLYGTGVALGSALASLTLLLDTAYGWRDALTIITGTGVGAALVALIVLPNDDVTVRPLPLTTVSETSLWADVQESTSTPRAQWIYAASLLRFSSGLCIGVWGAPYFRMAFADRVSDYAVIQAVISAVGATASGVLGGTLADFLSTARANDTSDNEGVPPLDLIGRRLWVPVVGSVLAVPTWYLCVHSDSFDVSMAWLAVEYCVAECWFGPTISTLQATVGPRIGGTAQGLFTLSGAMANLSPTLLGFLYSQAVVSTSASSSTELSNLLSTAVCFGYLSSAVCFAMAARASPVVLDKGTNELNS